MGLSPQGDWGSASLQSYILSRVWVTTDGVWIGDSIYWPLTDHNYK
jgi:hypothetical protein